jgi:uncharacterized protein YecT (DUF1311 family)
MDEQQRSGFWSTLPGVLTGTAALITAATGGFLAFDRSGNPAMVRAPQMETRPEPKPLALVGAAPAEASTSATPVTSPAPSAPPRLEIASGTPRPSFNCALASTAVENMLCSDVGLAERDRQVASQYYALRGSLPPTVRSQLLQSQRFFLDQRSHCTTSECLSELYDNRLRQLSEFASN